MSATKELDRLVAAQPEENDIVMSDSASAAALSASWVVVPQDRERHAAPQGFAGMPSQDWEMNNLFPVVSFRFDLRPPTLSSTLTPSLVQLAKVLRLLYPTGVVIHFICKFMPSENRQWDELDTAGNSYHRSQLQLAPSLFQRQVPPVIHFLIRFDTSWHIGKVLLIRAGYMLSLVVAKRILASAFMTQAHFV
ncbi:hypothetical protein BDP27DRAFT_1423764 [Rhodocollybia butyracea]|uniref:Uncharacterized protein n=1 Tax=Rhodocollybia butyracea TaxID=206335 RepID=A0A9P5PR80_9AGAR|nr:hypothetical protein BDP27DRAFT_1423764 [Rhodocollybia butyracea]